MASEAAALEICASLAENLPVTCSGDKGVGRDSGCAARVEAVAVVRSLRFLSLVSGDVMLARRAENTPSGRDSAGSRVALANSGDASLKSRWKAVRSVGSFPKIALMLDSLSVVASRNTSCKRVCAWVSSVVAAGIISSKGLSRNAA